jgi:hypothetical protein
MTRNILQLFYIYGKRLSFNSVLIPRILKSVFWNTKLRGMLLRNRYCKNCDLEYNYTYVETKSDPDLIWYIQSFLHNLDYPGSESGSGSGMERTVQLYNKTLGTAVRDSKFRMLHFKSLFSELYCKQNKSHLHLCFSFFIKSVLRQEWCTNK